MKKLFLLLAIVTASQTVFSQDEFPDGVTFGTKPYWNWHVYRESHSSHPLNQSLLFAITGGTPGETIRARLTHWGGLSLGGSTISSSDMLSVAGNADIRGNLYLNNISNYAGLRILFPNETTNNGADVDLTIDTNSGSPVVDWYIRNWYGTYVFNRGTNDGTGLTVKRSLFRIQGNGDIVVSQGNALVHGRVHAEEVKVEAAPWPDYIFAEGYELNSLEETYTYIKANGHLPGMPTVEEVEENGIELGEMSRLLLEKIEELTLHLIEKEKQVQEQNRALIVLSERISKLEAQ